MPSSCPRVLLRGGAVYSPAAPGATAMVTVGTGVAWVGDESGADRHVDDVDEVCHLGGRVVTPGFVDAHVHLEKTGFALQSLDLGSARTLTEALDRLAGHSARSAAGPLFAHGWDDSHWPEARPFTGAELERAVGSRLAYVGRVDSHSAVVTTALVARERSITTLPGWHGDGVVDRDANSAACAVVDSLRDGTQRREALLLALRSAARAGITSVHEANAPHIAPYDDREVVAALRAEHDLPEVIDYWGAFQGGEHADASLAGFAGDLCADGAIGSHTAALVAPYADADSSGHLYLDATAVRDHVVWCTRRKVQAGFHVIGDRALAEVAEGLRLAADLVGVDAMVAARHRLEHVEMPDAECVRTLARLGVAASVQPAFDAAWGGPGELYEQRLGAERARCMNPFASMRRAGVVLAFGSDSPVTPLDPWGAVRAAALHSCPDERLSLSAALDAHTRGGHQAHGDDTNGCLVSGAVASYAVWDAGAVPATAGTGMLPDVRRSTTRPVCLRTVVAGAVAFDTGSLT